MPFAIWGRRSGRPSAGNLCWAWKNRIRTPSTLFCTIQRSLFLLAVNPDTGATRQHNGPLPSEMGSWDCRRPPESNLPWELLQRPPPSLRSQNRKMGGPWTTRRRKRVFHLPPDHAPMGRFGRNLPLGELFCYDPETGSMRIWDAWTRTSSTAIQPQG